MGVTHQEQTQVDLQPLARALLDHVADGVVLLGSDGRVLYANQAARTALGLAEEWVDLGAVRGRALALGARAAPLEIEHRLVGEAIVVPAAGAGTLAERERRAILQALEETRGRLAETARRLGISRTTLWRRLKAYGLERHTDGPWRR